ncbi:MAG: valine--tRNA ligase [Bacteroidia bacterium]
MSIATKYSPEGIENTWYERWMAAGCFTSTPDEREPYTIVIPPPNVTGVLHMGHMLNNTIQDVLIRRARMQGKNACWVPGTDHASIATEAKVVAMLKERGIDKNDIGREEFLNYAWEWKEKYGGIILEQLKKLGASLDWNRTAFTMDPGLSEAVIDVFIDLYKKGYIYRGMRMVNWDPQGLTALADDEVVFKDVNSKMYHIRYQIEGSEEYVTIATVRPETIMADSAICIHPEDPRFAHLRGKNAIIPLINRAIPIIEDPYVTMDFGTGCLKVTPAHDPNDYELGQKHNLPVIDILNDNGTLNEKAQILVGEDRFVARKKIAKMLEESGNLVKAEDYKSNVGHSERTNAVVEPRLSMQWFVKMDEITKPALQYVLDGEIKLVPEKFINTYRHWMENVRDWCISRQLWWGHRIPAWYAPDGQIIVARTAEEAAAKSNGAFTAAQLKQDEDVLDTWFSSWLWPLSVFDPAIIRKSPEQANADLKYYYPTAVLVTAPEILFFWVARMIIAGHEYMGEIPFKDVYLTGIVRDKQGRKMSKSLGNSPDPLDLIAQYGADSVRVGMLFSSPAGNDLLFDMSQIEQGRNFANKIWNAFRLIKGWEVVEGDSGNPGVKWFGERLKSAIASIERDYSSYRLSEMIRTLYKLIWDDFCSWYLEMIKPAYQQPIDRATYEATIGYFDQLMRLLHPLMPFITEELWHEIDASRGETEFLCLAAYPAVEDFDQSYLDSATKALDLISEIRNIRNQNQVPVKDLVELYVPASEAIYKEYEAIICKLANVEKINFVSEKQSGLVSFLIRTDECYLDLRLEIDPEAEREKLQKELIYQQGFLNSVMKKLSNEKFVAGAPAAVLENERKKQSDAESKIAQLTEAIERLA